MRSEQGRQRYAGKHVVVAGTGASAQNALVELAQLAESAPGTRVTWLVRRPSVGNAFGGGDNDQLEARGALGKSAERAAGSGAVTARTSFRTASVEQQTDGRLTVTDFDGQTVTDVDEIVAVTGFRPDLAFLSEVRLDLDPVLQSPRTLAPLIDPNVHSCGTVYPHGAKELVQPEPGFYLVGMKSYGRAPSFLTLTGCEQVRSRHRRHRRRPRGRRPCRARPPRHRGLRWLGLVRRVRRWWLLRARGARTDHDRPCQIERLPVTDRERSLER